MKIIQELLRKMSFGIPSPQSHRPSLNTAEQWRAYWEAQGQPWRKEPEIDQQRQAALAQRRDIVPNVKQGIYPFKGVQLNRADVEWLLATHENGRGPVDWNDEGQRRRNGLDLRGADLRGVDLSHLPLACLCGGEHTKYEWLPVTHTLSGSAGIRLEDTNLSEAHLEGANLIYAHLERSDLSRAYLREADLRLAHLERAFLYAAHLEGTNFYRAHLDAATLNGTYLSASTKLREITLGSKQLGFVLLSAVHWDGVDLSVVNWTQMHSLGDEYRARRRRDKSGKRKDTASRLSEYQAAVRANRQLAVALQAQGLNEQAARFAYRAQVLQRCVFWFEMAQQKEKLRQRGQALGAWLFSWFLFLLAGYGYKPE